MRGRRTLAAVLLTAGAVFAALPLMWMAVVLTVLLAAATYWQTRGRSAAVEY